MRKVLMLVAVVAVFGTLSFAGVARESYKVGKSAGKESAKVVKFAAKKSAPVVKPTAKFVSYPERHPKKFAKGFYRGAKKVLY